MTERSLRWRFIVGAGLAVGCVMLMLSFAAVLSTAAASTRTYRRAFVQLAVALFGSAAGFAVLWPAVQQLRQKLLEPGPLVGAALMTLPATFVVWGVAYVLSHMLFR